MTIFTPSRGDVALNKSGLGPVLYSSATHRDLKFGHSEVPFFVSAQPVLMGFFPVSFQHWLMGTFSYTACFFTYCISSSRAFRTKTGSNHPPLASSQYFPSRIEFSSCKICPPSLLRLRFFSIWGCQVEGSHLCSTCYVHRRRSVSCVVNLLPKTLADLGVQILSSFGSFHPSGNMWAVCEEVHSFSVSLISCVTKRVEDIMPALQAYHARKRELRCVATEIMQEPSSF